MKHIVIVVDDRPGVLADISYLLGKSKINMENVSVEVVGGKGIIHIFLKDDTKARKILTINGYNVISPEHIVLRLENKPGEWAKAAGLLKKEKINILNVQLLTKGRTHHIYSLITDNNKKAEKVLSSYLWLEDVP
ncbi:MAG: ACT domain-containing protein [Candidatus Anstonellales archaeon]